MAANYTPSFYFQANRMRQHEDLRSLSDDVGRWRPPRVYPGNLIKSGQSTGRIFHFNGSRANEVEYLPPGLVPYRVTSMYYSLGEFWIVPYDCTKFEVGTGRNTYVHRDDSSGDDDAEGEEEETQKPEVNSLDWSLLRFYWKPQAYMSELWLGGAQPHLSTQRENQRWANKLFPTPYRAEFGRRTGDQLYGGLNGDLSILIALLAFSVYDGAVGEAFQHSIRAVHTPGSNGGWRIHNRPDEEGWVDRRGFVVTVWAWPPYSTNEHLFNLERGAYGRIWR